MIVQNRRNLSFLVIITVGSIMYMYVSIKRFDISAQIIKADETINQPKDFLNGESTSNTTDSTSRSSKRNRVVLNVTLQSIQTKRNVIFIITDDMRAQLGSHGQAQTEFGSTMLKTPHLDRLASRSLLLKKAFVQYSLCGPSRTSIMTGRRPDSTKVYNNNDLWRIVGGNFTTLPQHFKNNGYKAVGIGKIFHGDINPGTVNGDVDPRSWSVPFVQANLSMEDKFSNKFSQEMPQIDYKAVTKEELDNLGGLLPDQQAIRDAKEYLIKLAPKARSGETPFFMALGFLRPHLPFVCPKEFFDLYPLEREKQFLSKPEWQSPKLKVGCSLANTTMDGEIKRLPHETLRHLRRGYFSCVSFVDSLVGELIKIVDDLGLTQSTVISFVADHGYHLGENGEFGKNTLYDASTHVPMMVHVPGITDQGVQSYSITETIDLFPTLVQAAGLEPVAKCPNNNVNVTLCTDGLSMLPLIKEPDSEITTGAISQLKNNAKRHRYSLRTNKYRLVRCFDKSNVNNTSVFEFTTFQTPSCQVELYDHQRDYGEQENVAENPSYYQILDQLQNQLLNTISQF